MKRVHLLLICLILCVGNITSLDATADFVQGTPEIKSIGSLAFGPEGVLFVGDSQGAAVFALDFGDKTANTKNERLEVQDIDKKIASMLGTTVKDVQIHDLAVNPISQNVYLSVSRGRGNDTIYLLLSISPGGEISEVSLENVKYAKKELSNPVGVDAKTRRGGSLRVDAITDLVYSDGQLLIAGLSNEEFSSTLRATRFPFEDKESATSLEIYHAAHRRYETNSPIRTFLTYTLKDVSYVLAAYTCTPLVTFPMSAIEDGVHIKGNTVAELGSGNRPLDMLVYQNDDKEYILIANSNRTLMKIDPADIEKQEKGLTEPVSGRHHTAGAEYVAIAQVGVQQIDNLNDEYVVAIQRMANGSLNLKSFPKRRL